MSEFHQRLKSKIIPCDTKPKENEIDRIKRIYNSFIRDNDQYNEKINSLLRTYVNLAFDEIKESIRCIINTYYTPEDVEHLKVLKVGAAW
ncbi:MAG: hypothetical protein NT106_01305, partial [Candidatus Sumerlaeota bacterium]|nr:hypothetical protein [Candidatus Sumerlaeota bacterium]